MFEKHAEAINSYDDDNDENTITNIQTKEEGYEELRYKFNEGVNNFVFVQMVFYYVYASFIVYVFLKGRIVNCHPSLPCFYLSLDIITRYYIDRKSSSKALLD